jgi:hypothetical protein
MIFYPTSSQENDMRRQSAIENLAKKYHFRLKRSKRHLVWEHKVNLLTVVTPMSPSDRRSLFLVERRFQQVSKLPKNTLEPNVQ